MSIASTLSYIDAITIIVFDKNNPKTRMIIFIQRNVYFLFSKSFQSKKYINIQVLYFTLSILFRILSID